MFVFGRKSCIGNPESVNRKSSKTASIIDLANFRSVDWTGTKMVAVGNTDTNTGVIFVSSDGESWDSVPIDQTHSLNSIAWTGNKLIAVGDSCTVLSSSDGVTWTKIQSGGTIDYLSVASTVNGFIIGTNKGTILSSRNYLNQPVYRDATGPSIYSITGNGKILVAVGQAETILSATENCLVSISSETTPINNSFSLHISNGQLRYTLPMVDRVKISVFDIGGRWIASVMDKVQYPGDYICSLSAGKLKNGAYILDFNAGTAKERAIFFITK